MQFASIDLYVKPHFPELLRIRRDASFAHRRSVARRTASDDDYVLRRLRGTGCTLLLGLLLADEDLAPACFNPPADDWVERRRAKCLAGAKTKARVVPRATDGITY